MSMPATKPIALNGVARALVTNCGEEGCGRRGPCLPALDWNCDHDWSKWPPPSVERSGISFYIANLIFHYPFRIPVDHSVRYLRRVHRPDWRPVCARCLARLYVKG